RLSAALAGKQPVTVLARRRARMMCTFPNEVVTCRLPTGRTRRVFCKYGAGHNHNAFGHRGGIAYEAQVYRRVLQQCPDARPRFLGSHTDRADGDTWLMLECVNRFVRLSDVSRWQGTRRAD